MDESNNIQWVKNKTNGWKIGSMFLFYIFKRIANALFGYEPEKCQLLCNNIASTMFLPKHMMRQAKQAEEHEAPNI